MYKFNLTLSRLLKILKIWTLSLSKGPNLGVTPGASTSSAIGLPAFSTASSGFRTLTEWLCLIFFLNFLSCSDKEKQDPEQKIIARVGERTITADEFKFSYEFSFAPLRAGENPKLVYLNFMINELLLANEGYRQGLDKSDYVVKRVKRRKNHDLLEAFYHKYVYSKVKVPEEELQEATKKATVKWRMIMWPVTSLGEAQRIKMETETETSSLENYISHQLKKQDVPLKNKKFFETDWMDFYDIRPNVLAAIENLEIGKTSDPIPYGDGYVLIQILDINLHGIKEDELKHGPKRKKMYERLFDVRADRISQALMDSVLTPRDIRLKGQIVEQLSPALYQWVQSGLPRSTSLLEMVQQPTDTAAGYLKSINRILDENLATTNDSSISVADYLEYMNFYRKNLNGSQSAKEFRERLITEIGRMIKNTSFIAIAEKEGFADSTSIKDDLRIWERKWTYDVQRGQFVNDLTITDAELQEFFKNRWRELDIANVDTTRFYKYEAEAHNLLLHEKHQALLEDKLTELKKRYPVSINYKLLQDIEVDSSAKSQEISMFVTKKFSGESLVPIVDMKWLQY
ncbi:MAG: hypothetical protein DWQ05_11475 [Calditrichaeota bacterium]|nr:MAG: hypothetical protein DWQ05_11475 [Calditrichota bacterium]